LQGERKKKGDGMPLNDETEVTLDFAGQGFAMVEDVGEGVKMGAIRVFEEPRRLPCALNEAELNARGDELATAVQELARAETEEAERRKAVKARLTEMELKVSDLAETVKSRREERDVMVVGELVGMAEGPMVREVRMDTGEMIGLRQPTAQERQPEVRRVRLVFVPTFGSGMA